MYNNITAVESMSELVFGFAPMPLMSKVMRYRGVCPICSYYLPVFEFAK